MMEVGNMQPQFVCNELSVMSAHRAQHRAVATCASDEFKIAFNHGTRVLGQRIAMMSSC